MNAFMNIYEKPSTCLSCILCTAEKEVVQRKGYFLTFIIKCIELCCMQGMALRGHRDDSTAPDKKHQGHCKSLLDFYIDADDNELEKQLEICRKSTS